MRLAPDPNIAIEGIEKSANMKNRSWVSIIFDLIKFKITLFVALSHGAGYFLFNKSFDLPFLYTTIGLFLVSCSSAILNQIQEQKADALMERTKQRPIPSGVITSVVASFFSIILVLCGSITLLVFGNLTALILAIATLFWYNVVYFYIKKYSQYAVIPGAIIGALPPLVGWTAAGGSILSTEIVVFAIFLFVWQLPHFWLLIMIYGNEYLKAGFPTLNKKYSITKLARINFTLEVVLVVFSAIFYRTGLLQTSFAYYLCLLLGLILLFKNRILFKKSLANREIKKVFMYLNFYILIVVTLIVTEIIILSN